MRPRARLKILKSGFTALREGHALLLGMKPPWLRRTRRKKINGWWYGHGAHLVTWSAVNAVALSKGPARLLATQPKDFPFQVSVMLSVFTFKCFFFPIPLSGFLFICISFECSGQKDDEEVKVNEFSEIFERLTQKHGRELPDFKLRVWARMLVSC